MMQNAAEVFPILDNENSLKANYYAEDGSVHGWEGSFWDIAARATKFILDYEKDSNRLLTLFSKKIRNTPRVEIIRIDPNTGNPDKSPLTLQKDDYDHANRAYYQGSPEAAWFILYSCLGSEHELMLTQKGVETYIKATS